MKMDQFTYKIIACLLIFTLLSAQRFAKLIFEEFKIDITNRMSSGLRLRCVVSDGQIDTGAVTMMPSYQSFNFPVHISYERDVKSTCYVFTFNGFHQDVIVFDELEKNRCGDIKFCNWYFHDDGIYRCPLSDYHCGKDRMEKAYSWINS